jgi:hypothetical protein
MAAPAGLPGPLLLPVAACGKGKASVSGTVYYEGKPMPGGFVYFEPEDGGAGGTATIDPETGKYSIEKLPTGKLKVAITPVGAFQGRGGPQGGAFKPPGVDKIKDAKGPPDPKGFDPASSKAKPVPVAPEYRDVQSSDITVELKKGPNEDIDFKVFRVKK